MTNQTFGRKLVWTAGAALVVLAMTLCLGAGTSVFAQKAHTEKRKEAKDQEAGQQSAVDAKDGKLEQQTPDEAKDLNEAIKKLLDRQPEQLKATYLPDG